MKLNAPKIPYTLEQAEIQHFSSEQELDGYEVYAVSTENATTTDLRIFSSVVKQYDFSDVQLQGGLYGRTL